MTMAALIQPSPWQVALDTLSVKDKYQLAIPHSNTSNLLGELLQATKDRQQLCLDKRWKIAWRNGWQIILRDVFEKAAKWIQKFKEAGDIAVQYDTSAASLPDSKRILGSLANSTGGTKEQLEKVHACEQQLQQSTNLVLGDLIGTLAVELRSLRKDQGDQYAALEKIISLYSDPLTQASGALVQVQAGIVEEERTALFRWLSTLNHRERHQHVYRDVLPGTGRWLLHNQTYVHWKASKNSSIFWVKGIPGCGKTKLVSTVVKGRLRAQGSASLSGSLAYVYCSRNDTTLAADAVVRSILKQLACSHEDGQIHPAIREEFEKRKLAATKASMELLSPSVNDCTSMLHSILDHRPATILIDGLDELDCDAISVILPLKGLIENSSNLLKILIASRADTTISAHLHGIPNIVISATDNSTDISLFVDTSLDVAIRERRLLKGKVSTDLRELIKSTLVQGASAMFLWASLHIQQLCDGHKYELESDVINALASLPTTLRSVIHQMYNRIEQYPTTAKEVAQRTISWLLVAERPLTVSELFTATCGMQSVEIGTAVSLCSGFVSTDATTNQITFADASIREYLQDLPEYSSSRLNALAASSCIRCLLDGSDALTVDDIDHINRDTPSFHTYSTFYWVRYLSRIGGTELDDDLRRSISAFVNEDDGQNLQFWMDDLEVLLPSGKFWPSQLVSELRACVCNKANPVFAACVYGIPLLLDEAPSSWDVRNHYGAAPLYAGTWEYLLQAAAHGDHDAIVRSLVAAGANPWQKGRFNSAIEAAIAGARQSTTILLLSECVSDDITQPQKWLEMASYNGLHEVVDWLVDNVGRQQLQVGNTSTTQYPHDALQGALYRGRTRVAVKLLQSLPDVNVPGGYFENALQAACVGSHCTLVSKLLDMGAEPNSVGRYGSCLKAACISGKLEVVTLLLEKGAILGADHFNALELAASRGNIAISKLLIRVLPSENRTEEGNTFKKITSAALYAASAGGSCDITKLLLDNGAHPFAGQALEQALENHNHDIAHILFEHIDKLEDYNRFEVISCSFDGLNGCLHEAALESESPGTHRWRSEVFNFNPDSTSIPAFSSSSDQFLSRLMDQIEPSLKAAVNYDRNSLGGGHPDGKEYLERLVAIRGSAEDLAAMLSRGIDLNSHHYPSLMELAAKEGNMDVLASMLDRGAMLKGALQTAVYCSQIEVVRLILRKRPKVNVGEGTEWNAHYDSMIEKASALSLAVGHQPYDESMMNLLLWHKSKTTRSGPGPSLLVAVRQKSQQPLDLLLDTTCSAERQAWNKEEQLAISNAVYYAIGVNEIEVVKKLLDRTNVLSNYRQWLLDTMACRAARSAKIEAMEFVYGLAHPVDRERMARAVLLDVSSDPEMPKCSSETLTRVIIPHKGSDLEFIFRNLVRRGKYLKATKLLNEGTTTKLLQRHAEQNFVKVDTSIVHFVMQRMILDKLPVDSELLLHVLIKNEASVSAGDEKLKTPLYYACRQAWDQAFFLLLSAGADITVEHEHYGMDMNFPDFTLRMIQWVSDRTQTSEHECWSRIFFRLVEAGLLFDCSHHGLIVLFESACRHGLAVEVQKMLDPMTWVPLPSSSRPNEALLIESSGLHIAALNAQSPLLHYRYNMVQTSGL
ncbi:hypothetical protein CC86DRAFT_467052 [Ophiobolus disseminans]|uniref:Nephrocystin 3-like N-terminal domain-containing protein n=1 Tax=Ophiobolus disseminans TaxID=1469910 RepID=A0A6A6ZZL0_9PLEO|nr:hypothetical protein CC86DRAFT_467052 [Ophiobolus disseminans]